MVCRTANRNLTLILYGATFTRAPERTSSFKFDFRIQTNNDLLNDIDVRMKADDSDGLTKFRHRLLAYLPELQPNSVCSSVCNPNKAVHERNLV